MRFTIRELLWLTTIVALAATLFTDRQLQRRQHIKWAAEKERIMIDAAASVAAAKKQLIPLRHDNAILQHQIIVGMQKQMELERQLELATQTADRLIPFSRFEFSPPYPSETVEDAR